MEETEASKVEVLFKKELKDALNTSELCDFPEKLEPQKSAVPNLDNWRKRK
jgi:hypothetical protein